MFLSRLLSCVHWFTLTLLYISNCTVYISFWLKDGHKTCRNIAGINVNLNNWKWWFWKGSGTTYDPMWLQSLHWLKKSRRENKVSLVFLYLCTLSVAENPKFGMNMHYGQNLWWLFKPTSPLLLLTDSLIRSACSYVFTYFWL